MSASSPTAKATSPKARQSIHRPPRSKGCKQCVLRHVKCDGQAGCCNNCDRLRLPCSGPIHGAVFLDMTERVAGGKKTQYAKRRQEFGGCASKEPGRSLEKESAALGRGVYQFVYETESSCSPSSTTNGSGTSGSSASYSDISTDSDSIDVDEYLCKAYYDEFTASTYHSQDGQLSLPPTLEATTYKEYCFIGQFVELVCSSRGSYTPLRQRSWLFGLPDLSVTTDLPCLKYSIRAAALINYAIAYRNRGAGMLAVRWYLAGIKNYRSTLLDPCAADAARQSVHAKDTGKSRMPYIPDSRAIWVPMMFSFFEASQGIRFDEEQHHHIAAVDMLLARGPEECVLGIEHSMMRSLRTLDALHSIMENRPGKFSHPAWLAAPFQVHPKISYDTIIDIFITFSGELGLPRISRPGITIHEAIYAIRDLPHSEKIQIIHRANALLYRLQQWWVEFEKEHRDIFSPGDPYPERCDRNQTMILPTEVLSAAVSWLLVKNETLAAGLVSLYSAAHIILHSALLEAQGPGSIAVHEAEVTTHSENALNCATYLNMINPFCGDSIRALFAIKIVSLLARGAALRERAILMLKGRSFWGTGTRDAFSTDTQDLR